jgi:16S rRNA (guanine527-N7)-methyltransferase
MPTPIEEFREALRSNMIDFGFELAEETVDKLSHYYELLRKWNPRLHLVAPCSPAEFAIRHVLESLMLLPHLPVNARVADVGSGGGLPLIPCLIARGDLRGTLIESSQKKGVFLREALRRVDALQSPQLIIARFQQMRAPEMDFLTSRALDRFPEVLPALIDWAPPASTLLLFGGETLRRRVEELAPSVRTERVPKSEQRFLMITNRGV